MATGISMISASASSATFTGAGTSYVVKTPSGVFYTFFIDTNSDIVWCKSTDGGATWSAPSVMTATGAVAISIWYDRWSGIASGLIHVAYQDSTTDDTLYRSLDTENADAISAETVILAGASTLAGGCLSICRSRGGNLYCATMIDAGTEGGFMRSTDTGATWGARATVFEAALADQIILVPGWAADNQDMMAFYWDSDADEISRKVYDDSADTWGETSIAASMVDTAPTNHFPHFAATVDITNSRNLLVAWSAVDLLNADLRCWHVTESAITEVTNVVANSTDDQGFCAIGIDTDTEDWYVYYFGETGGGNTFQSSIQLFYKKSTDDGATWGSETAVTPRINTPSSLCMTPRFDGEKMARMLSTAAIAMFFDVAAGGRAVQINNTSLVG
jgi:hypothetical protein